ncbi:MAG: ribonuclease P protein component 4 [Thermoplasmata archaeon]
MVRRGRRRTKEDLQLAEERIRWLFETSRKFFNSGWLDHSKRCIQLARKIGMRYNVRVPNELKRLYCKTCYTLLIPGRTARVRVKKARVIITCQNCGNVLRYPYIREKHARKLEHARTSQN